MNIEEKRIASRISRRGFMGATAGATLAALAGSEPQLVRAAAPPATADAVIVLWMADGLALPDTFDQPRHDHGVRGRGGCGDRGRAPEVDGRREGADGGVGLPWPRECA